MRQYTVQQIGIFALLFLGCGDSKDTDDTATQNNTTTNTSHDYETISTDSTWTGNHTINGALTINSTLTIEACSTIHLAANAYISIIDGGRIVSQGSEDCMVTFTSAENSPQAGDWAYIEIYTNGNVFDWTTIEYGGNDYASIWVGDQGTVAITNSTFAHSEKGIELVSDATLTAFENNTFIAMNEFIMSVTTEQVRSITPITSIDNIGNFIEIKNSTLDRDSTWKNPSVPYKTSGFTLNADVTVEAGTVFLIEEDSYITVTDSGSLINNGTQAAPIVYTSASIEPQSGDWAYIDLYSNGNVFDWTVVEYGGKDFASVYCNDNSSISITNTVFSDSDKALHMRDGSTLHTFSNNTFTRIQEYPITVSPDHVAHLGSLTASENEHPSIEVSYGRLSSNGTWKNLALPYSINNMHINAIVTVEAGTTLWMVPDALITINDSGSLILDGTATASITVTSEKGTPLAGDWQEFDFYATSNNNNRFSYTNIMYGGGGGYGAVWLEEGAHLTLDHVTFSNNEQCDLHFASFSDVVIGSSTYNSCN